jgi:uncharacterized protein YndB with AHSA1/START domain
MSGSEFVYVTYIATTAECLWEALTNGELTKQYWYDRRIDSDWRPGSPVRFYDGDSDTVTDDGKVLAADRPGRLSYTFQPMGMPVGPLDGYSRVTFTLESLEGMVKLTLVHDELTDENMAREFREGWAPILSSLKTFLETGKPLPERRDMQEKGRGGRGDAGTRR